MEKEYIDPKQGRIRKDEFVLWNEKSSLFCFYLTVLLITTPIILVSLFYSIKEFGSIVGWMFNAPILLVLLICILVDLFMFSKEYYIITSEKVILYKRRQKLRYYFDFVEIIKATPKRNIIELLFNRGSVKLKVIHTTTTYTNQVVKRSIGHINMRYIKNYKFVAYYLNNINMQYINKQSIDTLFKFLIIEPKSIKVIAIKQLDYIIKNINPIDIIRFEKVLRSNKNNEYRNKLKNLLPESLFQKSLNEDEKISILGVCTFSSNGYFRERAVKSLINHDSVRIISFLLFRINDWVPQIRNIAINALKKYIDEKYCPIYINYLSLLLKLKDSNNVETSKVIESILSLFKNENGVKYIIMVISLLIMK